jgi:hypothetical protein
MVVSSESTELNYDPRGTKALISPGHQSIKYMGDVKHEIVGAYLLNVTGIGTSPFITDKKTSININANVGDVKFGTLAGSMHISATGGAKMPSLSGVKPGNITINSALGTSIKSSTPLLGKVEIDTGIVDIKAGVNVDVEATTKLDLKGMTGVDIEATTGDLKLEAKIGGVDIDAGTKIYLN